MGRDLSELHQPKKISSCLESLSLDCLRTVVKHHLDGANNSSCVRLRSVCVKLDSQPDHAFMINITLPAAGEKIATIMMARSTIRNLTLSSVQNRTCWTDIQTEQEDR